ncbi:cytochrome c biogenesis heme-transporting ATPase CcmA [Echinimonas agarilytica]|uniref:Cytochrome c biogenesis heme-transporting ATPase CcmA n=1 Tax=Echinimonas agarilytica TaxID=1215918 RepID=A0AA42B799_9GAMM|nr:cytochrome c biogenesis heme-transporting ATPase CcmA [Echinimonas agarilytica]MCM2678998.1 cytochrome c biogenesis heme-transporting ATPase CcmA [Echinimonas agarilytica]
MLEARSLSLARQSRQLFSHISFMLRPGQALLLEGRNGAGKTSMLRILAGLARPDEGDVYWQGEKISNSALFRDDLLYLGHQPAVNLELTPFENLRYLSALHGDNPQSIAEILAAVGLAGYEDVPSGNLSAGQQRRVALSRLWLSNSKLWILDEPLTALDVRAVAGLEKRFADHVANGGMLIVTTHQAAILPQQATIQLRLGEIQQEVES